MKVRTRRIEILASEEEYEALQQRKSKPRLAEWIRETALGVDVKQSVAVRAIDPELLYQLRRIGVNLNQITKELHRSNGNVDLVSIALSIGRIEAMMGELVSHADQAL